MCGAEIQLMQIDSSSERRGGGGILDEFIGLSVDLPSND
jgi:hypothetical protein